MSFSFFLFSFILLVSKEVQINADFDVTDLTNDEFQLDCLLSHNKFREKHCSIELKYSSKLKLFATRRAIEMAKQDGLNFGHIMNLPFGENMNWRQGKNSSGLSCKSIVELWYNEKRDYDWETDQDISTNSRHFTQLVWNSTQKVGCASVKGRNGLFTVCSYYPVGNVHENYSRNVGSIENCDNTSVLAKYRFKYRETTSGKWLQECIDEHNRIRISHGVISLSTNDEVFQYSRRRATDMAEKGYRFFRHIRSDKFGENMHWGKPGSKSGYISCKIPINKWYQEINNYDWTLRKEHNGTIRHFLQLVWKSTLNIGCAQVQNIEESKGDIVAFLNQHFYGHRYYSMSFYTVCAYTPKAYFRSIKQQIDNVFPDVSKTATTTQLITITANKHHYEENDDNSDDETELEKEFKDMDDVIDSRIEYRRQTEAPSLEDIVKTTTASYFNRAYNSFNRNQYIHKRKATQRRKQ